MIRLGIFKILDISILFFFFFTSCGPVPLARGQTVLGLPQPGTRVSLSPAYQPVIIQGLRVHSENPFLFDFYVDGGDAGHKGTDLQTDSERLIKYFLAALTVPEEEVWVNLSPYEKDRIVPDELGQTDMGRDMLAQDYLLKQITASLVYPEDALGKSFWDKVYKQAYERYGTINLPINTFNKVWIVPKKAVVYEHDGQAFILESSLEVMLEEDYLSLKQNRKDKDLGTDHVDDQGVKELNQMSSQVVREVVLPVLEKEVNGGENFAPLRQVYHSLILAAWYKRKLKESVINHAYTDQKKIAGIDIDDKQMKDKIYQQYLAAFKTGVYNFIKEEYDPQQQAAIPRKYFSGGTSLDFLNERAERLETLGREAALASNKYRYILQRFTNSGLYEIKTILADKKNKVKRAFQLFTTQNLPSFRNLFTKGVLLTAIFVGLTAQELQAGERSDKSPFQKLPSMIRDAKIYPAWGPDMRGFVVAIPLGKIQRQKINTEDSNESSEIWNTTGNWVAVGAEVGLVVFMSQYLNNDHDQLAYFLNIGAGAALNGFQQRESLFDANEILKRSLKLAMQIELSRNAPGGENNNYTSGIFINSAGLLEDPKSTTVKRILEIADLGNDHALNLETTAEFPVPDSPWRFSLNNYGKPLDFAGKDESADQFSFQPLTLSGVSNGDAEQGRALGEDAFLQTDSTSDLQLVTIEIGEGFNAQEDVMSQLSPDDRDALARLAGKDPEKFKEVIEALKAGIGPVSFYIEKEKPITTDAFLLGEDGVHTVAPSAATTSAQEKNVGGIDFNAERINLEVRNQGEPIEFSQQGVENLSVEGFLPVIIGITPATDLPFVLGLSAFSENGPP